jgi:hypothetical protein
MDLENDPRNPCFGCGPENPLGLRLRFTRAEGGASCSLEVRPEHQGWPGRLHSGVLYTAMIEAANWTVYALAGRVAFPARTSALDLSKRTAVGETLEIRGRAVGKALPPARIEVVARDAGGGQVAWLARDYEYLGRGEFMRRMGYGALPPELEETVPP